MFKIDYTITFNSNSSSILVKSKSKVDFSYSVTIQKTNKNVKFFIRRSIILANEKIILKINSIRCLK